MASPIDGRFSRGQFLGWALGGLAGTLPPITFQVIVFFLPGRFSDLTVIIVTIDLVAVGGFLGGGLGYVFAFIFDAPLYLKRDSRAAFLFAFTFTMLFYSLISFPLLSTASGDVARSDVLLAGLAFVSALGAGCLKGVLNNLKAEESFRGE